MLDIAIVRSDRDLQTRICSLSGLLPDLCNLLFYLIHLLGILSSIMVRNHGCKLVNLLLILPVGIRKKERMHCERVCLDNDNCNNASGTFTYMRHPTGCKTVIQLSCFMSCHRHELTC